jgi:antitoxin VapB
LSLNIKNPEAHELARKLAELTGESMSAAVTEALRERLARLKRKGVADQLMAIGQDFASRMSDETKTLDVDALLYDEQGLPK